MNLIESIFLISFFILPMVLGVVIRRVYRSYQRQQFFESLLPSQIANATELQSSSLAKASTFLNDYLLRLPGGVWLSKQLAQSRLPAEVNLGSISLVTLGMVFICWNIGSLLRMNPLLLMGVGVMIELALIVYVIFDARRKDQLEQHLPLLLESWAKIYRIHPDLKEAVGRSVLSLPDSSLRRVIEQVIQLSRTGLSTIEALELVAKEKDNQALSFVVSSIRLNVSVGSNLAHFFQKTAAMLKTRGQTERQIASLLFQNKISALVASGVVPAVFLLSMAFSQNYRSVVIEDQLARMLVGLALLWWPIGVVMVSRVVKVRV